MKKDDMIEKIIAMVEDFGLALEKSKCSKKSVQTLIKRIKKTELKYDFVHQLYIHLNHMAIHEWLDFDKAWKLVPEETWAFYDMMGYVDLREQTILDLCCNKFKIAWKKLPKFIKKEHAK